MTRLQLGERQSTDGSTRLVHSSDDCHQFVLDDDGEPGYGSLMIRQNSPHER
jgi:hypothetical protein